MNNSQCSLLYKENQNKKLQLTIKSLNKRFKILIAVVIITFICFLTFLILYVTDHCHCDFSSQCSVRNQFIRLNNTNLQTLQIAFDIEQSQLGSKIVQKQQFAIAQNNSLPILNKIDNVLSNAIPTVIINNNLGLIQSLIINKKNQAFKFFNNTFQKLKILNFSQCLLLNFADISNNIMPNIEQLSIVSSPLINFQRSQTFRHIKQLHIQNTGILDFSSHDYLDLWNLTIIQKQLTTFQNNNFNVLKYWNCIGCNFVDICVGNRFPRLQVFNLMNSTNKIDNMNCFNDSKDLSSLTFYSSTLSSINNFYLPQLKKLRIGSSLITQFTGNIFPSLDSFYLVSSAENVKFQINSYSVNLTTFEIHSKGSLQIKNQNFKKLTKLLIQNMDALSFKNNTLPAITTLYLSGLIDGSDFDEQTKINPNIQGISIVNSPKLTSFNYMSELPKISRVSLYGNSLTTLNCSSFKNVVNLQLNQNKFQSSIIQTLINCDFPNINYINLSNNKIENMNQARAQLQNKYNKAQIMM